MLVFFLLHFTPINSFADARSARRALQIDWEKIWKIDYLLFIQRDSNDKIIIQWPFEKYEFLNVFNELCAVRELPPIPTFAFAEIWVLLLSGAGILKPNLRNTFA